MTEKLELYKCHICGNLIQVIINGQGDLVCCGHLMEHLVPQEYEGGELSEKHVPQIVDREGLRFVELKSHPMTVEHYIQFIEAYSKDKTFMCLKYLKPDDIAELDVSFFKGEIEALEHCNIHGLWRSKND